MEQFAQQLVNGLIIGSTYALIGIGLTLIFGLMEVVNFAHGELYMLGAYFAYQLTAVMGMNFFLALVVSMLAVMFLGVLFERGVLRPLRGSNILTTAIVTIGLSMILQNVALIIWSGRPQDIRSPFSAAPLRAGPLFFTQGKLFIFAASALLIWGMHLFIRRTRPGKAMRATFQNRSAAAALGIGVDRIYALAFLLGSGLAAAAGVLVGSVFSVYPTMGVMAVIKAFTIAILGGLGSFQGAILGGLFLGVTESLAAGYISVGLKDAIGFVLVILVLLFRPQGLLGVRVRSH